MTGKPIVGSMKAQKVKNKGKKISKNILTLSKDLIWPVVNEENSVRINEILKKNVHVLRNNTPKVPWYVLMKLTKEQRKERVQEEINKLPSDERDKISQVTEARKHIAIGVNSCLRMMEQQRLLFCLLDSSEEPKLLIDKILSLAKEKQIVTALVSNLTETLNSVLGFKVFIIGFKLSLEENNCPIKECSEIKQIIDGLNLKTWDVIDKDQDTKPEIKSSIVQERLTDMYLYRTDCTQRVFRPQPHLSSSSDFTKISFEKSEPMKLDEDGSGFGTSRKWEKSKIKKFESPLVLTVQNNPNKKRKNKHKK